jgi:beta-lactamase superfamily II metal-dependent hydrolase
MKNAIHLLQSQKGSQMQSLLITTEDGRVIAVDGGWRRDADYFISYLKELTGKDVPHIDAWFLTHSHQDHIDAFLEIMQNKRDQVTVGKIYYNFPSVQYFTRVEEPDASAAKTATEFYEALPLFADKICIVTGGDVIEVGDARIDVLYSPEWDIQRNICNNSSIVFKMTLGGRTALILGDCGVEAGERILAHYGKEVLSSDVCQMGHHGQRGVNRAFYESVRPEICLWCTPQWLWDNDRGQGFDTHIYETVRVREWMEALGVKKHYIDKDGTQVCEL